jgi:murein DD-endopeptidase MepM/ murein hydrolase activator NlpD
MKASSPSQKLSSCARQRARAAAQGRVALGLLVALLLLALAACASPALTSAPPRAMQSPAPAETATVPEVQLPAQPEVSVTPLTEGEPTSAPPDFTLTPAPSQNYPVVAIPTINPDNPLRFTFPTAAVFPTPLNWRPPLLGVPYSLGPCDHFWFARPIASDSVNYPLGSYRYGSTYFGQMSIHAGIDIDAPEGTPILAAGPGQVVWVGYGLFNFNPGYEKDPYGIAVAVLHDFGYNNQPLYTLYAHMRAENNLFVGQRVNTGDVLGWIGVTGNTTGPHLHFEVRVGKNNYFTTRNPELWIAPYSGWGTLLGQVLDVHGHPLYGTAITIYTSTGKYVDALTTYGYRVANPDDQWHEHFVTSDLPAGTYHIQAQITSTISNTLEIMSGNVKLIAGQPHFVIFQEGVGFIDNASPGQTATPPFPSDTPTWTPTPTDTATPTLTPTRRPTFTIAPSRTRWPTWTLTPSRTRWPTWTPTPTRTPRASPQATPAANSTARTP